MIKVGSNPGKRFKELYKLDRSGYIVPKFVKKDGSFVRDTEDFWQSIQDSSLEEKFNQIFNDKKNQDQVMSLMRKFASVVNDDIIFEDITTGREYVDLMNDFVKLNNAFPGKDGYSDMSTLSDRIQNFVNKRLEFYEAQKNKDVKKVKSEVKPDVKE